MCYNGRRAWHTKEVTEFKEWLERNNFSLTDPQYNFGYHPVGQVALKESFGTTDCQEVWPILSKYLDIYSISTDDVTTTYNYTWTDADYYQQQIERLKPGYDYSSRR